MHGTLASEAAPLKIFLSYSRKDGAFAEELMAGLEAAGFAPYLDKQDIAAGEDWEARLGRLIESADIVVFVLSPDAVASKRCEWEVARARDLKKRLFPIVFRQVDESRVPERLRRLNYIFFDQPYSFGPALKTLVCALRTDVEWVHEHTRLNEIAIRWDERARIDALLLRNAELAAAKEWLKAQPKFAQEPTTLQLEFIKASEVTEDARSTAEQKRLDQIRDAIEHEKEALAAAQTALNKEKRALAATIALATIMTIGSIGWYHQGVVREFVNWQTRVRPFKLANFEGRALTPEAESKLAPGQEFRECVEGCPAMIVVPAGMLLMGSSEHDPGHEARESPQQRVTFSSRVAVGKYPVTFSEWDACVRVGVCSEVSDSGFGKNEPNGRANRPVINVTWDEAKLYVNWLSEMTGRRYRLLTESEWEHAARADTTTAFWWGDDVGVGRANCAGCGGRWSLETPPVGSFEANPFGLFDMNGTVFQWVEDCYLPTLQGIPLDGSARVHPGCAQRVVRGGSFIDPPSSARSARRDGLVQNQRVSDIGLRVARTISGGDH